jgi:endonuclease/exonuclease/phosphatase family metal-dependent hydrolase
MHTLKIMTYNIHYGIGRDGRYDVNRIIEVIAAEDPDVVTLQEVDNKVARTRCDNQPRLIAEALGMNYYHCVNRFIGDGEFGIATLSKFLFTHIKRFDLSYHSRLEPRGTLRTDIRLDQETNLHVFNVHFGLRPWERHFQRRRLFSDEILLHETVCYPVIVMGDFNDQIMSVVHGAFRRYLVDSSTHLRGCKESTFSWGPFGLRLDRIYIDKTLYAVESYTLRSPLAFQASDHVPVITRIALDKEGGKQCGI